MAEYIKREDAQNMLEKAQIITDAEGEFFGYCTEDVDINAIPAADVVEVVRCKDCVHRDPEDRRCDCGELERAGAFFAVADDYFCAYGERRTKE